MRGTKRTRLNREESQARTRERLLESAAREVARRGTGASIRDIAEAAGYSQGALYANFNSKELLFLELLRQHMERNVRALEALSVHSRDRRDGLLVALDSWLEAMNSDRDWSALSVELQMHAARDKAFAVHYDRLFAEHRQAMGRLTERLFAASGRELPAPPLEIASALIALAHGLVLQRRPTKPGSPDPAGRLIKLFIKGLLEISPLKPGTAPQPPAGRG
jgi:AcrR family transcriptional regulator